MSNPRELQRIPVIPFDPTHPPPWREDPPAGFHRQADDTLMCPHRDITCCQECADAHREIVEVVGVHYWVRTEIEALELFAELEGSVPATPAEIDHESAVREVARSDAESLDFEAPGFAAAVEVHCDRSDDEAPGPLELAIAALGSDEVKRIYEGEWETILRDTNRDLSAAASKCDHVEWSPACPFCCAPAMAIAPGKPGRRYLVIRYDVTDLTDDQIDTLAHEAIVQGEASDHDDSPCGKCEACLSPHVGEQPNCRERLVNHPDVEAERVEVIACR